MTTPTTEKRRLRSAMLALDLRCLQSVTANVRPQCWSSPNTSLTTNTRPTIIMAPLWLYHLPDRRPSTKDQSTQLRWYHRARHRLQISDLRSYKALKSFVRSSHSQSTNSINSAVRVRVCPGLVRKEGSQRRRKNAAPNTVSLVSYINYTLIETSWCRSLHWRKHLRNPFCSVF